LPLVAAVALATAFSLGPAAPASADSLRCPLTFYVEDERIPPVLIGELEFRVAYPRPSLRFAGSGIGVECNKLIAGGTGDFDDDDLGTLDIRLTSTTGISSLIQLLATCTTVSDELPKGADFVVTLVRQNKLGGEAVILPVPVRFLLPETEECETLVSTTTTSTTSTTSTTDTTLMTVTTSTTSTTLEESPAECGDPNADTAISATDALITLNAAVGIVACDPCTCDVDGSGVIAASDALILLGIAVGQTTELRCAPCAAAVRAGR
jgi:hypothetical protein